MDRTWVDTLEALRHLTRAGFPINADKLQLLRLALNLLGVLLKSSQIQLGHKAIRKLFGS